MPRISILISLTSLAIISYSNCSYKKNKPKNEKSPSYSGLDNPNQNNNSSSENQTPQKIQNNNPQIPQPINNLGSAPNQNNICYKADQNICEIEQAVVKYTNQLRQANGIAQPFRFSQRLTFAARKWSETQAQRGRISHDGFSRQRLQVIAQEFGNTNGTRVFAENVLFNNIGNNRNPDQLGLRIVRQWEGSSGHRRNMLSNNSRGPIALGAGIAFRGNQIYATQIFGID